jgi:hypothetical protein
VADAFHLDHVFDGETARRGQGRHGGGGGHGGTECSQEQQT